VPVREAAGLAQEERQRAGVADRIAGEQHHVPLDPVADERAPVGGEEVLRVAAELEERERVAAVRADELVRQAPVLPRRLARRRKRPEREVGDGEQAAEGDRAGRERKPDDVVAEGDRPVPPEQQVGGLAGNESRRVDVSDGSDEPADEGDDGGCTGERPEEDAAIGPVVPDIEGAAAEPEHSAGDEREEGLLEVEALEQVERAEGEQQAECDPPRTVAPAPEVEGADDQGDARRDGDRVEERHELDRLDLEEQMAAPGDVRGQRGREVHRADGQRRRSGDRGEALEPAALSQRGRHAVDPEAPAGGVAEAGEEVAPVLGDEPGRRGGEGERDLVVLEHGHREGC
jgi:hypothetical protein